jgi:hypothetical protein
MALNPVEKLMNEVRKITEPSNGGKRSISISEPYTVNVSLRGVADILFHRWNAEAVDVKSKAAKNSAAKKTDDLESYVYRDEAGNLCLPGEYVRQSIIGAAKFRQDPRSPRKSAQDLFKAGIVSLTALASLGTAKWDYEDRRRVVIQRNGVNRIRPAMRVGWKADFQLMSNLPEYIDPDLLQEVLEMAGRLIGLGDFRPTYGRFAVASFSVSE